MEVEERDISKVALKLKENQKEFNFQWKQDEVQFD